MPVGGITKGWTLGTWVVSEYLCSIGVEGSYAREAVTTFASLNDRKSEKGMTPSQLLRVMTVENVKFRLTYSVMHTLNYDREPCLAKMICDYVLRDVDWLSLVDGFLVDNVKGYEPLEAWNGGGQ